MTYKVGDKIRISDRMQKGYSYVLEAPMGRAFASGFAPFFTPRKMLELGVFEGKYLNDCRQEFPANWFEKAKTSKVADPSLNFFKIKSRQSLQV